MSELVAITVSALWSLLSLTTAAGVGMEIAPEKFADVQFPGYEQGDCSPEAPDVFGWQGLLVNTPQRISFGAEDKAYIPICTFIQASEWDDSKYLFEVVVRNVEQAEGRVIKLPRAPDYDTSNEIPLPDIPLPESEDAISPDDAYLVEYRNVDLAEHIRIDRKSARYAVTVNYLGFESEPVVIELVFE
jgi:hypothetical protein